MGLFTYTSVSMGFIRIRYCRFRVFCLLTSTGANSLLIASAYVLAKTDNFTVRSVVKPQPLAM